MELKKYIEAAKALNAFSDWVQWNLVGRQQQIEYLKLRIKDHRNKRVKKAYQTEIIKLKSEDLWN